MINLANIDYLAVAAATAVSFLLGFGWYVAFSKPWMTALGLKAEDVDSAGISMPKAITGSVVASFATAAGLAALFSGQESMNWTAGLLVGGLIWIAFSVGPMFKMVFWEDRPVALFAIDSGYELVSIIAATLIIFAWR